jgi:hypothetical protein
MTRSARLAGARAALALPLHLRRAGLRSRRAAPPPAAVTAADAGAALRVGMAVLARLARLRLPLWKNTCLYRSVLECVLLRGYGRAAVLRIGVAGAGVPSRSFAAHAWVEVDGDAGLAGARGFTVLRVPGAAS